MNSIEFSASIFAKEKYSGSAGNKRIYASKNCPEFQVQPINGKMFLVLTGVLNEYTEKNWDGTPKPHIYDRKVEIQLGLESCGKLIDLLQEKGLIQIQIEQTK